MIPSKLLVTGAAGFIGCALAKALMERGFYLIGVDDFSRNQAPRSWMQLPWHQTIDRDVFAQDMEKLLHGVDAVFHLGARTDTMATDGPLLQKLNLQYSQALWSACASKSIPFLFASSASVYGDGSLGYDDAPEKTLLYQPLNLYAQSKQDFDLWTQQQSKCPPYFAGFRFFNVYGPGEAHKGRMASVMWHGYHQIKLKGEIRLFASDREGLADGAQCRDFIYVDDVVAALIALWERPGAQGIYNLGTGISSTFNDLARSLFAALGKPEAIRYIPMPKPLQGKYQYFTQAETHRLRSQAGYTAPFSTLETGVAQYVDWLERHGA